MGSKDEMVAFIEDNFLRRTDVYIPTFDVIIFLYACLCFHFTQIDTNIHKNHHFQASPFFIAAGRAKHINKFSITKYLWTSTTYTPCFTGIPPHVILMLEIESLKATFENHTRDIVQEMRNELNERNVSGYLHKSGCVLDKIKADNEYFLSKLENLSGKYNSNYDGEVVISNYYFVFNNVIGRRMNSILMVVAVVVALPPPCF